MYVIAHTSCVIYSRKLLSMFTLLFAAQAYPLAPFDLVSGCDLLSLPIFGTSQVVSHYDHASSSAMARLVVLKLTLCMLLMRSLCQDDLVSDILTSTMAMVTWFGAFCMYICLAMLCIHHRKCRFMVLTLTLNLLLVPSYMGFFLAMTFPTIIIPLIFCLCGVFGFCCTMGRAVSRFTACARPKRQRFQAFNAFTFVFQDFHRPSKAL